MLVMAGAMALGGGLYTVVVDSLMLRAVEFDVESVTIGSAAIALRHATPKVTISSFLIMLFSK
jgi:hypothetical protein